jgi:S1-C subfamily serine protease
MTEEEFEASAHEQASLPDSDTQPIALPSVTPPPGTPPLASPPPLDAAETAPPTASYALGALSGNPHLGPPPGSSYQGPPPNYGYVWPPPPPSAAPAEPVRSHRTAKVVGIFGAAVVLLAAGVGIGHAAWETPTPIASSASGNTGAGSGSTGSGSTGSGGIDNPFNGNGNGLGGGNTGSGSSGGTGPSDASSIASKVDPGLVDIDTSLGYQSEQAAGTGIVLTSSGEILTNNHVIDGATSISVTDVGNGKTYTASVVGYDRQKDVAVLQLHGASGLQTATIGDSSKVSVGQNVVGIGNAGGTGGTPSFAGGTVTALNQSITASDEGDGTSEQLTGLIETNADIQAGDSGGSLVNGSGQVIGMDTAASAGFSFQNGNGAGGQGYAIPINAALSIAKAIEAGNASTTVHVGATGFLGVEIEADSGQGGQSNNGFGFGGNTAPTQSGATVAGVVTSSPAQEAGLAQGDVITRVNSTTVTSAEGVTDALETLHPGDKVTLTWTDTSGNSQSASVTLTSGPPQ